MPLTLPTTKPPSRRTWALTVLSLFTLAAACISHETTPCAPACKATERCEEGQCIPDTTGSSTTGMGGAATASPTTGTFSGGAGGCPADATCGSTCCEPGQFCALSSVCAPEQDPCKDNDDCWFDSYCEGGLCIPYETPPNVDHDTECENEIDINAVVPNLQCRWDKPPMGDPYPNRFQVMSTPVVVDFDFDNDPKTLTPSIVFSTFPTVGAYHSPGVIRVIDGQSCTHQFTVGGGSDFVMSPAGPAVGDIDQDGRPEIVAAAHQGGLLAFKYDPVSKTFKRFWRSGTCQGGQGPPTTPDTTGGTDEWAGPSLHDLDDDGDAEIIYGSTVYRNNGCILSNALGYGPYKKGQVPVLADVDEDGQIELIRGNTLHGWSAQGKQWTAESYFQGSGSDGFTAVADMGDFPVASLGNKDFAEVVVISSGTARVQTIDGTVVFGPYNLPGGGSGGPPTVADFDGDGRNEFASAGGENYIVFDLDCVPNGNANQCGSANKTDGLLWIQPSKDKSSNMTGSSVFDFDGNGSAEAVYADECFLRIYEGATGNVLYSATRSSGTTYENPVIADVDGDFRTEIVSAVNDYANLNCPANDPLSPGSKHESQHGIIVLRDEQDRWAASRPVWNQHAYAVTHVTDAGGIPATSMTQLNWKTPGLNNFRQNVQGNLAALGEPDLTAGGTVGAVQCEGQNATIEARVCNRGTLPMVSGTKVSFYEGGLDGPSLCSAPIPTALQVAECSIISCKTPLGSAEIDVFVLVDPDGQTKECWENNNAALYREVACGKVPK